MCGREASLFRVKIEGAVLSVCKGCCSFGSIISAISEPRAEVRRHIIQAKPEIIEVVVSDFSNIVRRVREKLGLNQEDFAKKISEKESLVHKIETGHFVPSLDTARKLEKVLGVKLIEEVGEASSSVQSKEKSESLTLGDVVKIKKR